MYPNMADFANEVMDRIKDGDIVVTTLFMALALSVPAYSISGPAALPSATYLGNSIPTVGCPVSINQACSPDEVDTLHRILANQLSNVEGGKI